MRAKLTRLTHIRDRAGLHIAIAALAHLAGTLAVQATARPSNAKAFPLKNAGAAY